MVTHMIPIQAGISDILGVEFFDMQSVVSLLIRFGFNMLVIYIIVRGLYFSASRRKDYMFSYVLISGVVFLLCFLLDTVGIGVGFALGLFAIFGIIRYRTNPIPIKEMSYLFVVIGISVINGLATSDVSYAELVFTNIALILMIYLLEKDWGTRKEFSKSVRYGKIDMIRPEKRDELISELNEKTGLDITRIEIGRINLIRNRVTIKVYYLEDPSSNNQGNRKIRR